MVFHVFRVQKWNANVPILYCTEMSLHMALPGFEFTN